MNYRISFPADYNNIPALRDMIFHTAILEGYSNKQAERIRSVTDELCNNAIEYGSKPGSEVILELLSDENSIKITCQDQGQGNRLKAADIKEKMEEAGSISSSRGRGLKMIVKAFADELKIEDRKEGGIRVEALFIKQ